ncbi:MAG: signal peptidase II [Actinomycetota bacterium]|nr:signal peptidase II [Actinomycetota bacterium]MDD5601128.1 signal peptidase II [Actinomycetota bacterium]
MADKKTRNILLSVYFVMAATGVLVLDQATKYLVIQKVPINTSVEVIDGFFYITHVNNTGAAFGIFQEYTKVLTVISIVAIFLIVLLKLVVKIDTVLYNISLGFILGGALGNLIDRYFVGRVTDFLNFTFFGAVFNIADLFINVGFILAIIILLIEYRKEKRLKRS